MKIYNFTFGVEGTFSPTADKSHIGNFWYIVWAKHNKTKQKYVLLKTFSNINDAQRHCIFFNKFYKRANCLNTAAAFEREQGLWTFYN